MIGSREFASEAKQRPYSTRADLAECRRLHRRFGTSYFFSTRFFPAELRRRTHALYGFVRVADEYADDLAASRDQRSKALAEFRAEFLRGMEGVRPASPVLRAFCDVVAERRIPLEEPLRFLDAMASDFDVANYSSYGELRRYMRGSAVAVAFMMCHILNARLDPEVAAGAQSLAEAMQLTNFLRDVGEDLDRGRVYIPIEDLESFGLSLQDVSSRQVSPSFKRLMQFEIARARALYAEANRTIGLLPPNAQKPVRLASRLYSKTLDHIEANGHDVFTKRARTSRLEKVRLALPILLRD